MKKFMVVAMLAAVCAGCLAKVAYAENEPIETVAVGQQLDKKSADNGKTYIYKICEKVGEIINLKPAN